MYTGPGPSEALCTMGSKSSDGSDDSTNEALGSTEGCASGSGSGYI